MTEQTGAPTPPARRPLPLGPIALGISVIALGASALPWLIPGALDGPVRAYLLKHPEVLLEMSQALQTREADAHVQAIAEAARANPQVLAVGSEEAAFGPSDAKVTVIEYFDFRCPACRAVLPQYMELMRSHPEVRFVFRDWPILDRGDDRTSTTMALAALAAQRQGRYLEAYQALMGDGDLSPEGIDRALAEAGVDVARAHADMATPETVRRLADIHTGAATLRLGATPTFLVNDHPIVGGDMQALERAITAAKADSPPQANGNDMAPPSHSAAAREAAASDAVGSPSADSASDRTK